MDGRLGRATGAAIVVALLAAAPASAGTGVSVSEDDWATLHLSASAWRRIAVAFADAVWALAPHVSWPPTYLAAAVLKGMGKVP